jgi:hypothetical protein
MATRREGAMHVATTRRHYTAKDGQQRRYETHLLRRSYRDRTGKPKNETLANLSHLPGEVIEQLRRSLAGETLVGADEVFELVRSRGHGHVAAAAAMAEQLGLPQLLGPACGERDVAFALVVARVCQPDSKLATVRWWADTTLCPDAGLGDVSVDDAYAAMDWLVAQQPAIERALADRHLEPGGLALYDVSSSWLEGTTCPLAARGYSRDGKKATPQIVYGLLADTAGRPVAVNAFAGNTADPSAFAATVETVTQRFELDHLVVVGDRGMITGARIDALRARDETIEWITALRAPQIKQLATSGALQLSLFDETGLAEIADVDYLGERLVACRNPAVAAHRARTRDELLAATDAEFDKVARQVAAGRLKDAGKIGVRAGKAAARYKMAKHYHLRIDHGEFTYHRDDDSIAAEAAVDGIYVIRTPVDHYRLDTPGVVEAYKQLANVETDWRSIKTVDIDIRPIHYRLEHRVAAHLLLCMLARYVTWHLRQAWAPLCFTDEHPPARTDPVAPAQRCHSAHRKASRQTTADGEPVHSYQSLLAHLATLTRDRVRFADTDAEIDKLTQPTPTQQRAFDLLTTPVPTTIPGT